jgi:hypothetical protein
MMSNFLQSIGRGKVVSCKYPKHGTRNILKRHVGTVERAGFGPNGPYVTLRHADGTARTLRYDRMVDPVVQ